MNDLTTLSGNHDVCLKALTAHDLTDLTLLANDPNVAKNLRDAFPSPYSFHDAQEFLSLLESGVIKHTWGIYYQQQIAGVLSITPQTDIYQHTAEIGYWLGAPFHGKGIMTEAVSLATAYALREMNVQRIFAGVFAPNEASKKVLLKNGYYLEAIRKNAVIKNGVLYDDYFFVKLNT